jgi:DNA-binding MarR family transcriptional regulator
MAADPASPSSLAQHRFDTSNRLFFRLYQCANLVHKNGTRAVEVYGTTTQQWAVIGALARPQVHQSGMTIKDLIEFLQVSRQNASAIIDRLAERGVLERVRGEADARERLVRLTEAGDALWAAMREPIETFYEGALQHLSSAEQASLIGLLDKLRQGLATEDAAN